jgi:exopolysaccharide biosynthesis polyprenyl glycosylphosphotransferase
MILRRGWSPIGFTLLAFLLDQFLFWACFSGAFILTFPRLVPHILQETWYLFFVPFLFYGLYLKLLFVTWALFTLLLTAFGTYRNAYQTTFAYQSSQAVKALVLTMIVVFGGLALFQFEGVSLDFCLALFGLLLMTVPLFKLIIGDLRLLLGRLGAASVRTVLAGSPGQLQQLLHRFYSEVMASYEVVGVLPDRREHGLTLEKKVKVLPPRNFRERLLALNPQQVFLPLSPEAPEALPGLRELCREHGISLRLIPCEATVVRAGESRVHDLLGIPLEMGRPRSHFGLRYALKHVMDYVLAGLALVVLLPFLVGIAVLIKLDSPGPVFYLQPRLTRHGRRFRIIKFRSMHVDADQRLEELRRKSEVTGPIFKMKNDPRVTRVGRLLRKLSLDEIPQFINVLQGHLSLVGPRPPIPEEVEKYEPWQLLRLDVLAGITGLWQVSGRSNIDFEEMVLLDLYYIENWSLLLDLEILLDTLPTVFLGRGAY